MRTMVKALILILTLTFTLTGLSSSVEAHSFFKKNKLCRKYKAYRYKNYCQNSDSGKGFSFLGFKRKKLTQSRASYIGGANYGTVQDYTNRQSEIRKFLDIEEYGQKVYVNDVKYYEEDGEFYRSVEDGYVVVDNPHVTYEQKILCGQTDQIITNQKNSCSLPAVSSCSASEPACSYGR